MFRMGGSTENVGIMDGMRQRYAESDPKGVQPKRSVLSTPGLSPFLIDFGLNLLSATPRGNIFATAASAAQDPFRRFQERQALVKGYMAQYSGDPYAYQKAVNRADFDLGIRDALQQQYQDDIIAGVIDFDITDPKQAESFAKASKNKIGQIFYDINTRTPYRLVEIGGKPNFQKLTGDKEGDALPEPEEKPFYGFPTYKQPPKPGFTIPPKGAFEDPAA